MTDRELSIWVQLALAFGFAALSGFIAYLQQYAVKKKDRPEWDWFEAGIKSATAGLAGFFTMLITKKLGMDLYISATMVGIAGWGGAETINFLREVLQDGIRRAAGRLGPGNGDGEEHASDAPR